MGPSPTSGRSRRRSGPRRVIVAAAGGGARGAPPRHLEPAPVRPLCKVDQAPEVALYRAHPDPAGLQRLPRPLVAVVDAHREVREEGLHALERPPPPSMALPEEDGMD